MSMNFHIQGFDTYQTPTQITNMIMANIKGQVLFEKKGKDALFAIRIYTEYIKCITNGAWNDIDALNNAKRDAENHVIKLNDFLSRTKIRKLVVYKM